jgi:hypothetical protein
MTREWDPIGETFDVDQPDEPSEPDDYDEDAEHDAWHPHWIEGCDACIDRANQLEERHLEAVPRSIGDTCCGSCGPGLCYVDEVSHA